MKTIKVRQEIFSVESLQVNKNCMKHKLLLNHHCWWGDYCGRLIKLRPRDLTPFDFFVLFIIIFPLSDVISINPQRLRFLSFLPLTLRLH